jgi:polysaccharide export outer membrane protein
MSIRALTVGVITAILVAFYLPAAAAGQQAAPATAALAAAQPETDAQDTSADQNYILGPEDVVEIEVLGRADFRTRAKIGQDGMIQLPFLGTVSAGNRTTNQLADEIKKALETGGYFSNPIMRVEIVGFASRYVTVLGEVAKPGLVPVDRPYHLSELLARVGGVRETAADYVVVRGDKGPERRLSVKTLAMGDISQDPYIQPGQKIFAPKAEVFYISGQVRSPGTYPFDPDMSIRQAIARGGGLTDLGTDKKVKVTHVGGKAEKLKPEDKIHSGDVIVIGEKLF